MSEGSLVVVGAGIKLVSHLSRETTAAIEEAEKVLYLLADPVSKLWIAKQNSSAESLYSCYKQGKPRIQAYECMIDRILNYVRKNLSVCAVFYGHPGVFVYPSHEAIRLARLEGYHAKMLPAISAEDCLFADLGIDPGRSGCQSFESTDFLVHKRRFDPSSSLILWQIGVIGELGFERDMAYSAGGLNVLIEYLGEFYDLEHEIVVYEAAVYPCCEPDIQYVTLGKLTSARITQISTLYVPPKVSSPDSKMLTRLNLKSIDVPVTQRCWQPSN